MFIYFGELYLWAGREPGFGGLIPQIIPQQLVNLENYGRSAPQNVAHTGIKTQFLTL